MKHGMILAVALLCAAPAMAQQRPCTQRTAASMSSGAARTILEHCSTERHNAMWAWRRYVSENPDRALTGPGPRCARWPAVRYLSPDRIRAVCGNDVLWACFSYPRGRGDYVIYMNTDSPAGMRQEWFQSQMFFFFQWCDGGGL